MARKRPNGEGTIFQRRDDGRWVAEVYVLTASGRRKRRQRYAKSRAEARQKLTELLFLADQGLPVMDGSQKLGDYLAYWLEHVAQHSVRASTLASYRKMVDSYIAPAIGSKRLDRLNVRDIRIFLDQCRNTCRCCAQGTDAAREKPGCCAAGECCRRTLSVRSVQYIHAVLRNALATAVREETIGRNVAKLVRTETPKYGVGRGLSTNEARQLLDDLRGDRLYALYVLAVLLGLRRAELLGLGWKDVDLESGVLRVSQTLQRIDGRLQFVPPKSRRSERPVPLLGSARIALLARRDAQEEERKAAGVDWQEHGLVFTTRRGTPIEPRNLNRHFHKVRERVGLPIRLHDLRHTCVTLLLDLGVPPHIVRDIVGHSDIGVTMTIYAHVSMDEKKRAVERLNEEFQQR